MKKNTFTVVLDDEHRNFLKVAYEKEQEKFRLAWSSGNARTDRPLPRSLGAYFVQLALRQANTDFPPTPAIEDTPVHPPRQKRSRPGKGRPGGRGHAKRQLRRRPRVAR